MDTQDEVLAPTETTDLAPEEEYAAAFDEAASDEPAPAKTEAPVVAQAEEPAPTEAEQPAAKVEEPAAKVEEPVAKVEEPAPAKVEPAPVLTADAIAEAIAKAQAKQNQPPSEAPEEPKPFVADDFLDDGAKASIKKFEVEWPEEFAAVRKMLESETQARIANELRAFATQMNGVLAPLYRSVETVGVNTFWSEVTAVHPDAKQLTGELQAWIAEQPPLLRPALEKAATSGVPGEAVELLNLFKQAKGQTGAAPATPAPSAAQVPTPAPAKPAPKVAALSGVPAAQRPKPTAGADANDYDAAFEEALGVVNS